MAEAQASAARRRPLPRSIASLLAAGEPLWVASLAALFVIWGYDWIPRLIRLLGRAGQLETVEWAVYMSLLAVFPVVTLFVAVVLPRVFGRYAQTIVKASAVVFALWIGLLFVVEGRLAFALIALIPAVVTAVEEIGISRFGRAISSTTLSEFSLLLFVGIIAWMCAGSLVYWKGGSRWFVGENGHTISAIIGTLLAVSGIPLVSSAAPPAESRRNLKVIERVLSALAIAGLVVFSFRTNPVVEFYHWGFWTGPIEQLRQGGHLLWDTPSQYGFLSILVPHAMPARSWEAFWAFQSIIYAIVAFIMYAVFRRMRPGSGNLLLAVALVFTTLFFRPRSDSLILAAQMTPSGGPVRFIWCFVTLAYLLWAFDRHQGQKARPGRMGFPVMGHVIWLMSLLWSFEAAIYSSAIWFAAFAVYLVQRAASEKASGMSTTSIARRLIVSAAIPFILAAVLYLIVWAVYRITLGAGPDVAGYI
ncbi:MAG TPA: hypothetical protein VHM24_00595, partial [Gemmatimonadaceae bacterium]|nr:hypothetical protein [Gemmatimonadaceae bacterium]